MTTKREAAEGLLARVQSLLADYEDELREKSVDEDTVSVGRYDIEIRIVADAWRDLDSLRAEWTPRPLTGLDAEARDG